MTLHLPLPDSSGIYNIEGISKVLIMEGRRGIGYPRDPNQSSSIWVLDQKETLLDLIRRALNTALVSSVKGNPPAEQAGQDVIDKFFATGALCREVDPDKKLDLELTRNCVHIDICGDSLNVEDRRIHDWPGIIDPLTIPQGSRAMQTFRLARGARVEGGRIVRGSRIMSETMDRNVVFPENDRPVRLLLTRSAFGGHEEVLDCEDPWTRSVDYRPGDLKGKHMLTAIVADRTNFADCISISESGAQRLACYRRKSQTIVDTHPVDIKVRVGSVVQPGDVVAEIDEGLKDGKPRIRKIRTHKLVTKAEVVDVIRTETCVLGEPAERIRIRYECVYMLTDGDKLTTRHGNKGVVRIVPDKDMPEMEVRPEEWIRAEILINPFSFVSRRPFGAIREMVVNELSTREGKPIEVDHFGAEYRNEDLHAQGLDRKFPARINGTYLHFPVFFGWLYWLRLEHHAREKLSAVGSKKPLNFHGMNPDAGKVSGQRINLNVATILHAKGLEQTHKILHEANVERGAVRMTEDLMSVLAYDGQGHARARREGRS